MLSNDALLPGIDIFVNSFLLSILFLTKITWQCWRDRTLCWWCSCCLVNNKSCLTLRPMDCSMPGSPVLHCLPEPAQIHAHWVGDPIYLILCHPLLLLPSIFTSIRVFSESVRCIRWPKYWSFSFSISPSNEHSGLISFRMDWLDLLAVQGTLSTTILKHQFFSAMVQLSKSLNDYWKNPQLFFQLITLCSIIKIMTSFP